MSKRAILATALLLSSRSLFPFAHAQDIHLGSSGLTFVSQGKELRYGFNVDGKPVVSPDAKAGIFIGGKPITLIGTSHCTASPCILSATAADGTPLRIAITLAAHHATLTLSSTKILGDIRFVTGGAAPAYGLADHAVEQAHFSTLPNKQYNTDVTGFVNDSFLSGQGIAHSSATSSSIPNNASPSCLSTHIAKSSTPPANRSPRAYRISTARLPSTTSSATRTRFTSSIRTPATPPATRS